MVFASVGSCSVGLELPNRILMIISPRYDNYLLLPCLSSDNCSPAHRLRSSKETVNCRNHSCWGKRSKILQ